jgi:leucyl-tRNA synthetase
MTDFSTIQAKWQKKWEESRIFYASPDDRPKFFVSFPYPYINAYSHIGHLYTLMRVDTCARYRRLKGFNVLFPQGWHITGSPIVNAAKRVKEREPKQVKIMQDMGISEQDLPKFEDPEYWLEFFAPEFKKDYMTMGMSIDWSREFFTSSLNPHYDRFIQWQFNKLKEKGYVIKGKFPVVWCPKCNEAVGDHSRSEGEGETTQEFTLLKFKFGDECIVAATLRPETVYGQTNLWCGADIEYVKAKVGKETWIMSKECSEKLQDQDKDIEMIGAVKGSDLLGKKVKAPFVDNMIPILPSHFCDPDKGTGIVTSVPSDAPDDWMGLVDLKKDEKACKKYGLDTDEIKSLKPIPIIDSKGLGNLAAVKVCEDMGIKDQHDRKKLEEAKKLVYKKGFYEGVMAKNCGKHAGMPVEKAKDMVKKELLDSGQADKLYELTGYVVCRCLTPAMVKIVSDQWFLNYADEDWKDLARKCLSRMTLYPEKARSQFEHVIGWLHEWACTREEGLGTRLPWDEKWLIESLSDSTVYMAYYTINHILTEIPVEKVSDDLFDSILLGKDAPPGVDSAKVEAMRKEFNYWYPMDFRNSGKDLIQNHLTFFIFNHVAIFPEDKWPVGIGTNGWVTVDGQKMSKSLGNMIPLRDVAEKFSVDASRFTILAGGEGLDDPNWESDLAFSMKGKLAQLLEPGKLLEKGTDARRPIDDWAESQLNRLIREAGEFMDKTLFRSALQKIYFEMQQVIRWYSRRCNDEPNKEVMRKLVESQLIMLSPFTPHVCEEAWESLGKKGFVSLAGWPECDESKILPVDTEASIRTLLDDIRSVLKLAKLDKPSKIKLFTSPSWKYELFMMVRDKLAETQNPKEIIAAVMTTDLKKHGQDVMKIIPRLIQTGVSDIDETQEQETLQGALDFLKSEFSCEIELISAEQTREPKAKNAFPGKPAILVE